ncbi:hypothetical protein Pmani_039167 [Petrolisthes manimaculis]|uniref:Uncharacterized protein n=1 Tax=Petrolisthes manimaculis TaxID=1843537 RepID=A0AAE1NEN6_9EUCA|nr:hypothetical protein Pmani_039167 [Petrolisthes manimaculis]
MNQSEWMDGCGERKGKKVEDPGDLEKADSPVVDRTPCPGDPFVGDPQLMDIGALPPEHRVPRMVRNNDIPGEQLLQHPTPMCEETGGNCPGNTQEDQEVDPFINMEVTSADLGGGVVTRQQARGKLLRPLKVPEVKGMETFQDVSINPELSPEKQGDLEKADSPVVDRTPCPGDPFVGDPQLMDIAAEEGQRLLQQILQNFVNCRNEADDILT